MATHSTILAWKFSRMATPGRLQSMGSQRVGHWCYLTILESKDCLIMYCICLCVNYEVIISLGLGWGGSYKLPCVYVQAGLFSPTVCDSMDCSPPGSIVHGIFLVEY